MHKSDQVNRETEKLYKLFLSNGIEVLLDDRNERPGVMFADMELIGIPHRIVISDRGLIQSTAEYKGRTDQDARTVSLHEIVSFMLNKLCTN
jgi:prolyl-tRNA synthetase